MKNTNYSVKNRRSYGILLLALLLCGGVSAKVNNYVGGYANLGEWSMLPSGSKYTGSLGVAGGVGLYMSCVPARRTVRRVSSSMSEWEPGAV